MTKKNETIRNKGLNNLSLINKIYQSFETLEHVLGELKMEEALFMTYAAKKSFARAAMKEKPLCHFEVQKEKSGNTNSTTAS